MVKIDPEGRAPLPDHLAAAIHDATNALTAALGWLERGAMPGTDPSEALRAATMHARWARDELRALIEVAPPASLGVPPSATVEAGALLRGLCADLDQEARKAGVRLELRTCGVPDAAVVAPRRAWHVLANLILNGLAMTPAGGRVGVSVEANGEGRVRFVVEDDGPGIPPARREDLFAGGTSTRPGGAGVGLRRADELAAGCGGRLTLAAHHEPGARFELEWPVAGAAGAPPRPSTSGAGTATRLAGTRLLLLEDDRTISELLTTTLHARGAVVTAVETPKDAEAALEREGFDLLLTDLSPFGLPAAEVGAALGRLTELGRTHAPGLRVVAISGSGLDALDADLVWLRKPFDLAELTEALARALAPNGR